MSYFKEFLTYPGAADPSWRGVRGYSVAIQADSAEAAKARAAAYFRTSAASVTAAEPML